MIPILKRGYWMKSASFNNSEARTHFRDETEDGYVFRYWSRKWGGHWAYKFVPKEYAKWRIFENVIEIGKS